MKQTSSLSRLRPTLGVTVLALALAVSGCSIKLISSYDETTDKTVTALQKKTEAHLVALEAVEGLPECKYEKHKQFYDEAKWTSVLLLCAPLQFPRTKSPLNKPSSFQAVWIA